MKLNEPAIDRLHSMGASALTDCELLALLLGEGGMRRAQSLALRLLTHFGTLRRVLHAPCADLAAVSGLGSARSARLTVALELVRRSLLEHSREHDVIASPDAVRDLLRLSLAAREREVFVANYLDNRHRLLVIEELFQGTLTQTSVHPREVVKSALRCNAAAAIVAHNHPSGLAEPSQADRLLTDQLRQTLAQVDVRLLDHILIAGHQSLSFAERGLL